MYKAVNGPFEKPIKKLHRELLKVDISTWTTDGITSVRKYLHYT